MGGLSILIFSWAVGLGALTNFLGIGAVLGGLGLLATRALLGIEGITNDAYEYLKQQKIKGRKKELDLLDRKLTKDRDPRTQNTLRDLRSLYKTFAQDMKKDSNYEILEKVEDLFNACISQLEHSYELHKAARKLTLGSSKKRVMEEREQTIQEVLETVDHLSKTIEEFHVLASSRNQNNLTRLREELDETLDVARKTEERMATWTDDERTFE